ncbi:MAG TPA: pyrroloquinoline quinone biosynthesis peptide chaperone PqqD [Burkholderiales bacterium]|jgi:pyrroloquinoline quinone biosynthesis protein D
MSEAGEDLIFELARHYRFQWEPAQNAFVLLYPEGMVKLGGSAGEILKRVDGSSPVSAIISDLERTFPGVDLRRDVTEFLAHAREKGWLSVRSA